MSKELYPRREPKDRSYRRWRVDYDLAYDGGGSRWSGYYTTEWLARYYAWFNKTIASWGGTAVLVDLGARCSNPHCPHEDYDGR